MPDNLQFDRAEPSPGAAGMAGTMACKSCGSLLTDTYYVLNGHIVCEKCRRSVDAEWNRGGAAGRFAKALGLGVLAMIGCSVVWYLVLKATNAQWGILAILVGLAIGGAVRKGSNGRGGWRYQALAIFLTYTAIVTSYVPLIIQEYKSQRAQLTKVDTSKQTQALPRVLLDSAVVTPTAASTSTPAPTTTAETPAPAESKSAAQASESKLGPLGFVVGAVILLGVLYATPFLAGVENLLGLLIIGFALYQAWKMNRRAQLKVSGPYRVSMTGARA